MPVVVFALVCTLLVLAAPRGVFGKMGRTHPPGILIVEEPEQSSLQTPEHWVKGDYRITALARYSIRARVVDTQSYWFGREADLSPLDFLLAWGVASDSAVQDAITTSLSSRYYRWRASGRLPVDPGSISESMANTHLIPGSESVRRDLERISPGALVSLQGYLVNVSGPGGWKWTSSLTRRDAGQGACELMWVESAMELGGR